MFKKILEDIEDGKASCLELNLARKDGNLHIIRRFLPPQRLILLGGGHVAKPVCEVASKVEYDVIVVDDRPEFANRIRFPEAKKVFCDGFEQAITKLKITPYDYVAVITRGHKKDAECLRILLEQNMPFYLGLIGSKRRVRGLFDLLQEEGHDKELLDKIHTPIGLSIGAITPEEIAISIVAELIQCRRKQNAAASKRDVLVQENTDMELLRYLANPGEPAAYAIVLETKGSTPVKSGAIMAVNEIGKIYGTIGGGCSEHALMREALEVIKSGESKVITADMTNDIAETEGMVCGGKMEVYIKKLKGKE